MRFIIAAAVALLLLGCAGQRVYDEGLGLIDQGRYPEGLAKIQEAARLEPDNKTYRQGYMRERDLALQRLLALAEAARQQAEWKAAEEIYRQMLVLERDNARARSGLETLRVDERHRTVLTEAHALFAKGELTAAQDKARQILTEHSGNREAQALVRRIEERALRAAATGPRLTAALRIPATLEFRDASLRQVFELISKTSGLNFIFDRDVRQDLRTTVFVRDSTVEEVIRFVLVTNQLERKLLSENTMLIYPATAQKQRDYQELVVRTFYLSNTDVKTAANMIKTLVKTKDVHIDEKLNLIMMRDTPEAVRMAERLVANQDLAEPEVMLEVEVLEVGSSSLYELGIRYPDSVSASLVGAAGTAGTVTLPEWLSRGAELVRLTFTNPLFALNFRNTLGRTNLLANPRIRVKNKDKAKVHIGDKVPVITTTTTATGFASESVTYLDVGLKLDVEPSISLDNDVAIRVGLEVSSIAREIRSASGTLTYQVGTRNASTTLRLRDGETQVLAGLISDEDRKSAAQIPGLGSIPLVGRIFGNHQDTASKTEIMLLITPRVVRNLARPEIRLEEIASGTEAAIGAPPLVLQSAGVPPPGSGATLLTNAKTAPGGTRIALEAVRQSTGQEVMVVVRAESEAALRSGLLDFGFDPARLRFVRAEPGTLLRSADSGAAFRSSAPEGLGRLNLNFTSKADVSGVGELARLIFQPIGAASTPLTMRLEAVSFTDAAGQVVSAQMPPPLSLAGQR